MSNVGITKESVNAELQKQTDALIAEAEKAGAKFVEEARKKAEDLLGGKK